MYTNGVYFTAAAPRAGRFYCSKFIETDALRGRPALLLIKYQQFINNDIRKYLQSICKLLNNYYFCVAIRKARSHDRANSHINDAAAAVGCRRHYR